MFKSSSLVVYSLLFMFFFFFNDTATTEIYTLSLHDALPISLELESGRARWEESVDVILKALAGGPFSYEGKIYKIPETTIFPQMEQPRPPIWITAQSPDSS